MAVIWFTAIVKIKVLFSYLLLIVTIFRNIKSLENNRIMFLMIGLSFD